MTKAAESHHYIPKFILRNFLSNQRKEQVTVFQKSTSKSFVTNIRGVMAERRFNDFRIGPDLYLGFEQAFCRIEDLVLPVYSALVEKVGLSKMAEEADMLALFVAFQMVRVRAFRDELGGSFHQLRTHFSNLGIDPDKVEGLESVTDDELKRRHFEFIGNCIDGFRSAISAKDFLLLKAPKGRGFYLGDNPVVLRNEEINDGSWSNIGLAVKGIQIYVPLTHELMLAAWCPSIIEGIRSNVSRDRKDALHAKARATLSASSLETSRRAELNDTLKKMEKSLLKLEQFIEEAGSGKPILLTNANMDHYNALQVQSAREFVVCRKSDFDLARRVVAREGSTRGGFRLGIGKLGI
ncbi:DUF4238 domain-containing protein [Martelella endophytica]|uniref:DUF4238 domain-containing protein n=1 Tax=Martelella endophytica TaxID=1486262 RepID=A0A0D5LQZ8_MAREN|nr:DUF4238 domain-containing protein [Martelella endophytica]AJY46541.1 hypothetical protein TM49_14040 [Martelella endophytica]